MVLSPVHNNLNQMEFTVMAKKNTQVAGTEEIIKVPVHTHKGTVTTRNGEVIMADVKKLVPCTNADGSFMYDEAGNQKFMRPKGVRKSPPTVIAKKLRACTVALNKLLDMAADAKMSIEFGSKDAEGNVVALPGSARFELAPIRIVQEL